METPAQQNSWTEDLSQKFIDYGRYFVPEREYQMRLLVELLADVGPAATIMELCCGEGLLAEALLEAHPSCNMLAFDGSAEMLARAQRRLARFGERFQCRNFDLASTSWRSFDVPVNAVVSSLAIHHLDGLQKQKLYGDIFHMLAPGGALVIADVVDVVGAAAKRRAAEEWDDYVRRRAYELDGNTNAFDYFQQTGWNMYHYLDPEDIDKPSPLFDQFKWLEKAGFAEIDVNWMFVGQAVFSARKPADERGVLTLRDAIEDENVSLRAPLRLERWRRSQRHDVSIIAFYFHIRLRRLRRLKQIESGTIKCYNVFNKHLRKTVGCIPPYRRKEIAQTLS